MKIKLPKKAMRELPKMNLNRMNEARKVKVKFNMSARLKMTIGFLVKRRVGKVSKAVVRKGSEKVSVLLYGAKKFA